MIRYIIKRVFLVIPVLLGISLLIFTMLYFTPGDPAQLMLGMDASQEQIENLRKELGTDKPFWEQYGNYIWKIVTKGDLGTSYTTRRSVTTELVERFPKSLQLAFWSAVIATVTGILLGVISAVRQYSILDNISTMLGLVGLSMPNFWLGMILIIIFAVNLRWLPPSGVADWRGWVLPCITIGISNCAKVMRMTRSSMLEILRQDYIATARSKGLPEKTVIWRHAFRNALLPIITTVGMTFGGTMGGAIVTESVFSVPGVGKLMVDSINTLNYPMVQGGVLMLAAWFCLVNLGIDVIYAFVDPGIRAQYASKKKRRSKSSTAPKGGAAA